MVKHSTLYWTTRKLVMHSSRWLSKRLVSVSADALQLKKLKSARLWSCILGVSASLALVTEVMMLVWSWNQMSELVSKAKKVYKLPLHPISRLKNSANCASLFCGTEDSLIDAVPCLRSSCSIVVLSSQLSKRSSLSFSTSLQSQSTTASWCSVMPLSTLPCLCSH